MFDYNIFLPEISRRTISESLAFLRENNVNIELHPNFDPGKKAPYKRLLHIAVDPSFIKDWPLGNSKLLCGFNLDVKPFDLRKTEESQKKSLKNLFGLKKSDNSVLDIADIRNNYDKATIAKLGSCKYEITITESMEFFGTDIFTPLFVVALSTAGRGMIWEGEFVSKREEIMEDYWPEDEEINELNLDIKDGDKPKLFTFWP